MFIYTTYQNQKSTINKLRRLKLFSQISVLNNNRLKLSTIKPVYSTDHKLIKKIQYALSKIDTITPYAFYPFTKKKITKRVNKAKPKRFSDENYKRSLYIFFDIDSTLTHNGISAINREVKSIFEKFKAHSCNLYFSTGRGYQEVKRLTKRYGFGHEYGIAENGGIILGMGDADSGLKRADKTEPKKLIAYLKENEIPYEEDKNQKSRKTEIVIDLHSISQTNMNKAIRKFKNKIECHTSKQAYHITKKGINKGTAVEVLTSEELEVDPKNEKVIGVGDSGLDLKMFEYCDENYLVGNNQRLKKQIKKNPDLKKKVSFLKKSAPYAVAELYEILFRFG